MPEITVLTAVRNGIKYLPATLKSIQAQTFEDWELILVDDASADDTPRLIEAEMKRDPRIKLIRRTQAGGPFVAAYDGLKYASGKFIARTDADDISLPQRFEQQLRFLKSHANTKACASFCQSLDDNGLVDYFYTAPKYSGSLKWYLCLRCPLIHSSAFVEIKTLKNIYQSSPALKRYLEWSEEPQAGAYAVVPDVEDYRMWCVLARDQVLQVIPDVLVYYRHHGHRVSVLRKNEQEALAKEVLSEHLGKVTNRGWSSQQVNALYAASHGQQFPIAAGLAALNEWDGLWTVDNSLNENERDELYRLSSFRRQRFLRSNARQRPFDFMKYVSGLCLHSRRTLVEHLKDGLLARSAEYPPVPRYNKLNAQNSIGLF
ncbi:MAG TPA: glycosyltransferase family A protein [Blastocatellia bacterium]|nr:glycosyltransferase family A protein [Blastocatellia bacterium]